MSEIILVDSIIDSYIRDKEYFNERDFVIAMNQIQTNQNSIIANLFKFPGFEYFMSGAGEKETAKNLRK